MKIDRVLLGILVGFGAIGLLGNGVLAQSVIVPDGTLGSERSQVEFRAASERITGGAARGINLFHSFREFNVGEGRTTYFLAPNSGIENILARVTGSNRSEILGRLGVLGGANLFLLNPNGIVFGPKASLDVVGSFTATTANAIEFGDRGVFSATNPTNALPPLTVNPSAYLFSQVPTGNIVNRSITPFSVGLPFLVGLQVPNGQRITLLGGDVALEGGVLSAWSGRIDIGAVAGIGRVDLAPTGALKLASDLARGNVTLSNGAQAVVVWSKGGDLSIAAANIRLTGGSLLWAGVDTLGGTATIRSGDVQLDATGTIQLAEASVIKNYAYPTTTGSVGNVKITANALDVTGKSEIRTDTAGRGDAGNISIQVRDRVLVQNSFVNSAVEAGGIGKAGNVEIVAGNVEVRDSAQLIAGTNGIGNAGNIVVNARDRVLVQNNSLIFSSVGLAGKGNGGNVAIAAGTVEVRDNSQLIAVTNGIGNAGNVAVNARDRVLFQNKSGAFSSVSATAKGNSGNVEIITGNLEVSGGAQLLTTTNGIGNAGNVKITASDFVLFQGVSADGQSLSSAFSSVQAKGRGNGGTMEIITGDLKVLGGAQLVTATQGNGNAGKLVVNAANSVLIDGTNASNGKSSAIFTNNGIANDLVGTGVGGNVLLTTPQLTVSHGAVIDARTVNDKPGGNLTLNLAQLNLLSGGQIFTNSEGKGPAGTLSISATDRITIKGSDPTYADRFAQFGRAVASINANSGLYVRSSNNGPAGDIILTTDRLTLDQQARIDAQSATVSGGNLFLTVPKLLLLRNGSQISATAGINNPQAPGDGGNITIDSRFIVAILTENSDITANATRGRGGNITINSEGILGLQLQPKLTPFSDITASSETGINGTINLNAPDTSFIQNSLNQLSKDAIDTTKLLSQTCLVRKDKPEGTFYIVGTGGLPHRPGDLSPSQYPTNTITPPQTANRPWQKGDPIVEPTGFYQLANGHLVMSRECSSEPIANP